MCMTRCCCIWLTIAVQLDIQRIRSAKEISSVCEVKYVTNVEDATAAEICLIPVQRLCAIRTMVRNW